MKSLKSFRAKTGISQLSLAAYLGVSKSLIWHAENGTRNLPDAAWNRLKDLFLQMETKKGPDKIPDNCIEFQSSKFAGGVEKIRDRIRDCKLNTYSVKKRLSRMQELYEASVGAFRLLHILEKEAVNNESIRGRSPWIDNHRQEITKLYDANSPAAQAMLQLRLDLLAAREKVYEDYLNKYGSE